MHCTAAPQPIYFNGECSKCAAKTMKNRLPRLSKDQNLHTGGALISVTPEVSWEDASFNTQRLFKYWKHAEVAALCGIKRRALINRISKLRRAHPDYDPHGLGGSLNDYQRWFLEEVNRLIYKPNSGISNAEAAQLVQQQKALFSKEKYKHETLRTRSSA